MPAKRRATKGKKQPNNKDKEKEKERLGRYHLI